MDDIINTIDTTSAKFSYPFASFPFPNLLTIEIPNTDTISQA